MGDRANIAVQQTDGTHIGCSRRTVSFRVYSGFSDEEVLQHRDCADWIQPVCTCDEKDAVGLCPGVGCAAVIQ